MHRNHESFMLLGTCLNRVHLMKQTICKKQCGLHEIHDMHKTMFACRGETATSVPDPAETAQQVEIGTNAARIVPTSPEDPPRHATRRGAPTRLPTCQRAFFSEIGLAHWPTAAPARSNSGRVSDNTFGLAAARTIHAWQRKFATQRGRPTVKQAASNSP